MSFKFICKRRNWQTFFSPFITRGRINKTNRPFTNNKTCKFNVYLSKVKQIIMTGLLQVKYCKHVMCIVSFCKPTVLVLNSRKKICEDQIPENCKNPGFSQNSLARIHFDSRGVLWTSRPDMTWRNLFPQKFKPAFQNGFNGKKLTSFAKSPIMHTCNKLQIQKT